MIINNCRCVFGATGIIVKGLRSDTTEDNTAGSDQYNECEQRKDQIDPPGKNTPGIIIALPYVSHVAFTFIHAIAEAVQLADRVTA